MQLGMTRAFRVEQQRRTGMPGRIRDALWVRRPWRRSVVMASPQYLVDPLETNDTRSNELPAEASLGDRHV